MAGAIPVPPLSLGTKISLDPPVILAPMAGITSAPYRRMCASYGASLCVSEMVSANGIIQRNAPTLKIASWDESEGLRSAQLYGVRPELVTDAVSWLVEERGVDHIDLNFGCPVRKVTAKGGGAAVPLKPKLLARLVRAAVGAAGEVPVTVKMRTGLDEGLLTFLTAGTAAQDEGAAAVTLHARTAAQLYHPTAQWDRVGELAQHLQVPVIGNGDVFEAADAVAMLRHTGAAGVMVGRANLGRPWLFEEIKDAMAGREPAQPPCLGGVLDVAQEHLRGNAEWMGNERAAVHSFRKFIFLYMYGFESAGALRGALMRAGDLREWEEAAADTSLYDPGEPFPEAGLRHQRLKGEGTQRVALPKGYLDNLDNDEAPVGADESVEG